MAPYLTGLSIDVKPGDGGRLVYDKARRTIVAQHEAEAKAQEIYICATEENRALKAEVERLKTLIAGVRIRVIHPDEDGYCGDGVNPGLELQWPDQP